jgi:hypothetical protein
VLGQLSIFKPDKALPLRQRVQVEIITLQQARYALEAFHYLHRARVGRQINYAVLIDGVVDGVITYAYPWTANPIASVPSDEVLEFARLFLYSNTPHVATCAIGKTLRRIKNDWMRAFPDAKPPRLVVSWSDTEYHKGTIYRAANFQHDGRTTGQNQWRPSRPTRGKGDDYKHIKDRWIFRLKG